MKAAMTIFLFWFVMLTVSVEVHAQDVKVTRLDRSTETGPLASLSKAEVVLRVKEQKYPFFGVIPGTETIIPLENVRTIERVSHGLRNGLWAGLGLGSDRVCCFTLPSTTGLIVPNPSSDCSVLSAWVRERQSGQSTTPHSATGDCCTPRHHRAPSGSRAPR